MTFEHLLNRFYAWGKFVKSTQEKHLKKYFFEMLNRKRVMIIQNGDSVEAILFFFLVNDVKTYANRPIWSTPEDTEDGHIIFIDKMVAHNWTRELRKIVQEQIESKFPQVTEAFWLREPLNRNVIIKRRREHVYSQVS